MRTLGNRLTDVRCRSASAGMHPDGNGLYLQVRHGTHGLTRSWVYRYSTADKQTWLGLGPYPLVTLAEAREKATDARRLRLEGNDPLAHRRNQRAAVRRQQAKQAVPSFDECRDQYVASHRAGWRNVRHSHDWVRSLETYVTPLFGSTPVDLIDTALVCKALEPIWRTRTETAARVRGRIEAVLNWAQTRGHRGNEPNPARWKGHLANIFPARRKVTAVEHLAAIPYADVPAFMASLRERNSVSAIALQYLVLTACRTSEVLGARWDEIDLSASTWTIPAGRMKGNVSHRVPLSKAAVRLLEEVAKATRWSDLPTSGFVFLGRNRSRATETTLYKYTRSLGCQYTVHGFRSTFRDWCAERTSYPAEVAEMALAHRVGSQVENAYRRTDMFERRRRLMTDWAAFCETPITDAEVIPIRA
jgi:integrase